MIKSSRRVVLAALAGNGAIALAKFAAAGISGSTAMLTEAIHSLVDTADQVLLLVGQTRGERPADATHPLGYGMEVYFWSFVVALMVFLVGGVLSMYEGMRQILNPIPVISPWISLTVLAVAAGFESTSFRIAYREYRRVVRGRPTRLWAFIKASKDPTLFAVLLEDSAALMGIGLAATGVIASGFFHITWADGAASVAVGLLLISVAWVLANETRSLIAGEAVAPIVMERLKEALSRVRLHHRSGRRRYPTPWSWRDSGRAHPCLPPRFHDRHDRGRNPRDYAGASKGRWPDRVCLCTPVGSARQSSRSRPVMSAMGH